MTSQTKHDVLLQENRRAELARRFISHGVRTKIIMRLTDLTVARLRTVRRRVGVPNEERARGPTRWSLKAFLKTPEAQAEGGALVALCANFDIPIEANTPALPKFVSLHFGERLCETYEAFCAVYAQTTLELEHLILVRRSLSVDPTKALVQVSKCRTCKALLLEDRFRPGECWHCDHGTTQKEGESRPRRPRGRARS